MIVLYTQIIKLAVLVIGIMGYRKKGYQLINQMVLKIKIGDGLNMKVMNI
jgi:hypothetical protein